MTAMQVRRDVIFISTFYSTSGQRPLRFAGGSPFTRGNRERRVDFAIMGKAVVHWSRLETGRLANPNEYRLVTCRIPRARRNCRRPCRPALPGRGYAETPT